MAKSSAFFFACRLLGAAAAYVTQVLLARWIGGEELGRYVNAFSWCMLLATVALLGFSSASLRFVGAALAATRPGLIAGLLLRGRRIVLGTGLALGLATAAVAVAWSRGAPGRDAGPLLAASLAIPAFAVLRFHSGIAHGFTWFPLTVLPSNVVRPLATLALLAGFWGAGMTLDATGVMVVHVAVLYVITAVHARRVGRRVRRALGPVQPEYETRHWLRTSTPLLFMALFTGFYPELNVILVGLFRPDTDIAVFNAAFRTAFLIAFALTAIDAVLLPSAARLAQAANRVELQRLVTRATRTRFACALAAVVGLALFGRQVLALFGAEFEAGHSVLVVLALSQLARAASGPVAELLGVTGHQDVSLVASVAGLAATVAVGVVMVPLYGILGAAWGVVLVTLASVIWLEIACARRLGVNTSILGGLLRRS